MTLACHGDTSKIFRIIMMSDDHPGLLKTALQRAKHQSPVNTGTLWVQSISPTTTRAHDAFEQLKEKIFLKRPVLRSLLEKNGHKKISSYAAEYVDVNLNPVIQHRQTELIETFQEEIERLYGKEIASKGAAQLSKHYFVSTADHMGPASHPFAVNSNLVTVSSCCERKTDPLEYLIVLPCASISFDNSTFPRGLQFHSAANPENPSLQSYGFFGRNCRPSPVCNYHSYTSEDFQRTEKLMNDDVRKGKILARERDMMMALFEEVYKKSEILERKTYSEQMCLTNFELWRKCFQGNSLSVPDLLYLEQETLVSKLLLKYHLDSDTTIWHILFDPECFDMIMHYFNGMDVAFSEEDGWGTYLFWAIPPGSKYRLQLWKRGNELVSTDGSYRVGLNPKDLRRALEAREIFSSTLMDFIVLSFYYGLKCLGGFNQVNYLTQMKNAYLKMQVDRGNYRSVETCARAQTKEMCDGFSLAFLGYGDTMSLATGIDFLLYGKPDSLSKILEVCKTITLSEALNPLLPEMYKIAYVASEWEKHLLEIDAKSIVQLTGLDRKIQPCMSLSSVSLSC